MKNINKAVVAIRAFSLAAVLVIPACIIPPSSPPVTAWGRAYGGSSGELATFEALPARSGGGIWLAGQTNSPVGGPGPGDILIAALKKNGDLEWAKVFGTSYEDSLGGVAGTPDGGLIAVGALGTPGFGYDLYALRLAADGSTVWQEKMVIGNHEAGRKVHPTADGGFVIGGSTESFIGWAEPWIIKLDSAGTPVWQFHYGRGELWTLQPTPDGGFIGSMNPGGEKILIFKIDANGAPVWGKLLDEVGAQYGQTILVTSDGGALLVGKSATGAPTGYEALAIRLQADGTVLWETRLAGPNWDEANGAVETAGGDFLICGSAFTGSKWEALLFKLHGDGTLAEQKLYSGAGYNFFKSIRKSEGNSFLISGESNSFAADPATSPIDLWVIQTDGNGVLPVPATTATFTWSAGTPVTTNQLPTATATSVVPVAVTGGAPATITVTPAP